MAVVARVKVTEVTAREFGSEVRCSAVMESHDPHSEEIRKFFEATPSLSLTMSINNAAAAEHFQPGEHHYLKLERVVG